MAVSGSRVTVTNAATQLTPVDADGIGGMSLGVKNTDASLTVYLGGASVTSATGYPLGPGEVANIDLRNDEPLYGITASGSAVVGVLVVGV